MAASSMYRQSRISLGSRKIMTQMARVAASDVNKMSSMSAAVMVNRI